MARGDLTSSPPLSTSPGLLGYSLPRPLRARRAKAEAWAGFIVGVSLAGGAASSVRAGGSSASRLSTAGRTADVMRGDRFMVGSPGGRIAAPARRGRRRHYVIRQAAT